VRHRIVVLSLLAATLAIALFGVPLAFVVARYLFEEERAELEAEALAVAVDVAGELARTGGFGEDAEAEHGVDVTVYDAEGHRVFGPGPDLADAPVRTALDGALGRGNDGYDMVSGVPVREDTDVVGAVRATTPRTAGVVRIAEVYLLMAGLAAAALGVTWVLARRAATRLAAPLERIAGTARALGDGDFGTRSRPTGIPEIDAVGSALNSTAERLGEIVGRERAFTADASHQLRTPLTGLRLGLEAALERPGQDLRSAITAALAGTERLHRTIDDLLALTRDRGRTLGPLRLPELLGEVEAEWGGTLADRGLRIEVPERLPAARGSNAAVRQVLGVLVDNAVRHGGGTVTVRVRESGDALAVDVADEGGGVHEDVDRLFARRPPRPGGHGIGLPLARSLAEAEGGRLTLSRAVPAVFTLLLPLEPDGPVTGPHRPADRGRVPGEG
jgi:signal transduction histidine kinase